MSDAVDELLATGDISVTNHGRGDAVDQLLASGASPKSAYEHFMDAVGVARRHPFTTAIGVGENALSSVAGGVGDLADAVTGAQPGTHDWAYRPRTEAGKEIASVGADESDAIGRTYDDAFGTGPLAQTVKESGKEALGAVGTVLGAAELPRGLSSARAPVRAPARVEPTLPFDSLLPENATGTTAASSGPPGTASVPQDLTLAPSDPTRMLPPTSRDPPSSTLPPLTATGGPRSAPFEPEDAVKPFIDDKPAAPKAQRPNSPNAVAAAKVLQDVGFTKSRTSALTNDGPAGMSEFQTSKDPTTPQGAEAHRIFANERATLNSFADNIVSKTGGTAGTDASALEGRGGTILKPFDDLGDYFDQQRRAAYNAADERSKGVPTDLKEFQEVLGDESHLTNQDRVGLKTGLNAYLKKLNVMDGNGNITASVQQAETIRKYLNDEWSPQNSKFAGKLKDAIDTDVTKAAGEDIYKPARAIVSQQKAILENPKGIADVLDASGPNGINRKVPVGQVADKITSLPPAQLKHIIDTLDNMPPEIQESAKAAKAELQSHFASRLSDVATKFDGPWNHRGVNQFMDNNAARAPIIFGKDNPMLKDMNTLRAAGNILRVDRSYPGAAIQGRILQSRLIPGAVAGGGTLLGEAIGSSLGAPGVGSMVGGAAGGAAALRMSQKAGVKALQRRMTKLSDLIKP